MSTITRYALVKVRSPAGRPRDRSAARGHTTARGSGDRKFIAGLGQEVADSGKGKRPRRSRRTRQAPRGSCRAPAPRGSRGARFLL